ncbi:MAG: helicase-related protein, partial [Armatimonadia bacterium]
MMYSANGDSRPDFQVGQLVALRADPHVFGAVVAVVASEPENRYSVFHDGRARSYYASQLQAHDAAQPPEDVVPLSEFTAYLTAVEVSQPAASTLHSLNSARIDFIPYQFRPVLRFIRSDRPRMLLADGVGVGKTIEAGLILRELQARQDVQSVLIICPRPLVTERKWEVEMRRFGERFVHLNGESLRYCLRELDLDGVWPQEYRKAIMPYSLFDEALLFGTGNHSGLRGRGLLAADPPPQFDMLIVDEAHHIKNSETHAHRAVRYLCDHAEAVLFLTATPIQLGSNDLFTLLNCIRPDLIIDQPSFEHMAAPNPHINKAVQHARAQGPTWQADAASALTKAVQTPWGQAVLDKDPRLHSTTDRLAQAALSPEERVSLINDMEQLHTFSGMLSRTRRRDIGDFTIRKPETIRVEFTQEQRVLHDAVLAVQARIMSELHGEHSVAFLMTTIRRQAASCLPALAPLLKHILTRRLDELVLEEADESYEGVSDKALLRIETAVRQVLAMAEVLPSYDPKLEALMRVIAEKQRLPNRRLMLFSSFRHTLAYLFENLHKAGYRVAQVHGGTPDEERVRARERFELPAEDPEAVDILLFSEIGCEGLDYQFCDCMVNYDLPWNPMRIEQRIGRIDRNGQRSETVAIYNLITKDTVDADIYDRCLLRIGIFDEALGASEEILGEITQQIRSVAESLKLTPGERQAKLQQIADNQIRKLQEERRLEEQQAELLGLSVPVATASQEVDDASSRWLSSNSVEAMVKHYLGRVCGGQGTYILGDGGVRTLRLSQDARHLLLADFRRTMKAATGLEHRLWEDWLKGSE